MVPSCVIWVDFFVNLKGSLMTQHDTVLTLCHISVKLSSPFTKLHKALACMVNNGWVSVKRHNELDKQHDYFIVSTRS